MNLYLIIIKIKSKNKQNQKPKGNIFLQISNGSFNVYLTTEIK